MMNITAGIQLENTNSGRGYEEACRKGELIVGKQPVVK
jgi:hypothetical protein